MEDVNDMSPHKEMAPAEIDQFLTCARTGRLGVIHKGEPYVVPVGFVYVNGLIAFHSCSKGQKMKALQANPQVCFEVDETLSDSSMYKSVLIYGKAEILTDNADKIPYLQAHIDKYRVPEEFGHYINKPSRKPEQEMKAVRIVVITPTRVTSRKFIKFERWSETQ
jgi:nitroimidazol reductase NimA-like FMN-containing flavoprotein (pyridoxamine 5'-phosphate oxidase superfamily)